MPQRASNLETLLMSLEILKRIPRGRKISAPELHRQLEAAGFVRDLRTVQRQLDSLSEHFEIERDDRSRPYGYSWKPQSFGLALPTLNEQESVLLTLAEQQLHSILPAKLMKSMEGFFDQARLRSQSALDKRKPGPWLDKVRVVSLYPRLLPPVLQEGIFENVSNALYSDHWLEIDYRNASGRRTSARVMPLGLAQQGARLLLACRFDGYQDDRSLSLHRMDRAKDTGISFERPPDFDLERYDDEGRFGFGQGKTIQLVFRLPAEPALHLKESPLSSDQKVVEVNGQYEFRASVVESRQLRWWLRGFGKQLTLISPKSLLDED
ncbi:WYL domain-containing protein [Variovorax sp. RO1]|uniref:helix-turn-helix transcriptional regulator n=1 Tax=Variovorax sp. RO1 TaxID=2066034 RepID=UPI000C717A45|nr:WYL domain-containing protein [Variovorax sp. RO1]PLC06035.1 WYL domain-containing protein [Variovorax sp. RO1]